MKFAQETIVRDIGYVRVLQYQKERERQREATRATGQNPGQPAGRAAFQIHRQCPGVNRVRHFIISECTNSPRGEFGRARVTSEMETNLLTHMFALCLRVDRWATDTAILAGDLSMPVAKVNQLFKSLGMIVAKYSTFR